MIILGSTNMDIVVRTKRAPQAGETILGDTYALYPGGKGANQAVAARRAGAAITFISCLGNDPYGDTLSHALHAEGIETIIPRVATPTGIALITVEPSGENRIIVIPGANHALTTAHLPPITRPTLLLAQLEIPIEIVLAAATTTRAAGGTTILNLSPIAGLDAATLAALLDRTDILLVNQTEAATLLNAPATLDPETAARTLAAGRRAAIITLGAAGLAWATTTQPGTIKPGTITSGRLPPHPVTVIDTTGCGDAFAGAFAAAIDRGDPIPTAAAFGNAAGALAATRSGAQPAMPSAAEIATLLTN